jgi:ABC-type multidrug transport system fused ATPase/permease subunit
MEGFNLLIKIVKANKKAFIIRESLHNRLHVAQLMPETILVAVGALGYYLPHYILKVFLDYLTNDPSRSMPAWGWLLAFGLFISNATFTILNGITFSIGTTTLQAGIRLQLNTLLFAKTLAKKDIAAAAEMSKKMAEKDKDSKAIGSSKSNKKDGDDKAEDEDEEGVSSKSQIMTLFTVDVDRVTDFVWHEFALIDAPIELIVATVFLLNLLGTSAAFGLLAALSESWSHPGSALLMIVCLPLNHFAAKVVVTAQENLMKARDSRTALMNEILQGIRMLKWVDGRESDSHQLTTGSWPGNDHSRSGSTESGRMSCTGRRGTT